ncbi:T9SS type A sorting domain-containing protein [Geojedonia litorea]|uniref:T9SS type A sorting domain-containing protein n=1 Tax=Geojedonia litorea TaxID=1268269 RepID=A0ABV9N285_9FLAO
MKIKILIIITLFLNLIAFAQPEIAWQNHFGSTQDDYAYSIVQTIDGGFVMAGYTLGSNVDVTNHHGGRDFWVVKTNSSGNLQWQKALGGAGTEVAFSIIQTSDNGYIVAGYANSFDGDITESFGGEDIWVVKLDSSGNLQWQKSYGNSNHQRAFSIIPTSGGGYVLTGVTRIDANDTDYIVIKLDNVGNVEWQYNYSYDTNNSNDEAHTIVQTLDGGYIVTGYSVLFEHLGLNYSDAWVIKLNSSGIAQWDIRYGGSLIDSLWDIQPSSDGGYIMAGYSSSTDGDITNNNGGEDYWVVKIDAMGNLQWQKSLGGSNSERAFSVRETTDGGYIVSGYTQSNDGDITNAKGSQDGWIVKLDNSGNLQWQKILGGTQSDIIRSIIQTTNSGYITIGNTSSNDSGVGNVVGRHDFWIVRFGPETLGVNDSQTDYERLLVYPNPSNGKIHLSTPFQGVLNYELTDINGRVFQKGILENNTINYQLNSGLYLLQLKNAEITITKKIIVD